MSTPTSQRLEGEELQQTALQPQRHWHLGFRNSLARFGQVDVENGTTRDFLQVRLGAERCNEPGIYGT